MNNDFQLGNSTEIKGAFQSIPTFTLLSSLTGSDVFNQFRLKEGQIFFVTESQKFFRVNKTPTGAVYDFIAGTLTGDDLAQASFEWEGANDITFTEVIFTSASVAVSASHANTASFISPTFISASAAASGFGDGSGDPTDISALNTFTGSFTDNPDGSQVRITIDAIPSESIFTMREISSGSFGTKASGSITVGTGFGTNADDTLHLDLDTGFVLSIQNFTTLSTFNGSNSDGATFNAASTTDFLLTASSFINDNSSFGATRNTAFTCDKIAGILSSSVNGSTLNLIRKTNGTFGNDFKIASGSQTLANISGSQTFGFGGGSSYTITEAQSRGDEIANIVVLDISGSNDNSAVLRRMDLLSFLQDTFIVPINDKLDTLLKQYNSNNNQAPSADINGDGTVSVADLLELLAQFGATIEVEALPTAQGVGTGADNRASGDVREGLRTAGAVTDQNDSVITNGTLTIGNQSSGSLVLEGAEFLTTPAKLDFLDKIGGTPGDSGSGTFISSGSLFFHSESIGSFRFNRPLSASNLSGTNTGDQDLSGLALKTAISGSFTVVSASFSTRVTANDAKLTANTSNVTTAGALMDSELTDLAAVKAINQGLTTTSNVIFNHITASGNISASNQITGKTLNINGVGTTNIHNDIINLGVDSGDRINTHAFFATRLHTTSHITASGNISASGELIGIIDGGSF